MIEIPKNKDSGGPKPLVRQGQRQVSGLPPAVGFLASVFQSTFRQLTLWGPLNFLVLKHVDS